MKKSNRIHIDLTPLLVKKRYYQETPLFHSIRFWRLFAVGGFSFLILSYICFAHFHKLSTANLVEKQEKLKQTITENEYAYEQSLKEAEQNYQEATKAIKEMYALQSSKPTDVARLAGLVSEITYTVDESRKKFLRDAVINAIRFQPKYSVPASAVVAMAIYESRYGESELSKNANNYFGLKALSKDWKGGVYTAYTVDSGKRHKQPFRKYKSMEEGFEGYVEFISSYSRYKNAFKNTHDGSAFVRELLRAGYCPDSDYLANINKIIERHKLHLLEDQLFHYEYDGKVDHIVLAYKSTDEKTNHN